MASQCMLTTFDNPFNPFEQFEEWFLFDVEKGYNTCAKLARIANLSEDLSDEEVKVETESAIDRIISNDFLSIYKKITKEAVEEQSQTV